MEIESWQSQLRKGAAELVVLSALADGEAYGLQILRKANAGGDLVSDGALYPMLARLEKGGRIVARWSTGSDGVAPRKFYTLTPQGRALADEMRARWSEFRKMVSAAVEKET
ncbi:PadR family transcriptional regulator [Sphingomonas endolithica]|jgi:PadR family transcriptional regulator PadR|uniref:PadR family transcriptional regulator n=1 Tax=Sphingomonas endolithica TaxID=2972485 RepID=UPI0021B02179|nr:PadR family transcriptional regulator [Sphingomonas sp. ZFBP2030]